MQQYSDKDVHRGYYMYIYIRLFAILLHYIYIYKYSESKTRTNHTGLIRKFIKSHNKLASKYGEQKFF